MTCTHVSSRVLERRVDGEGLTRRRRLCCACGLRFTTYGDGEREVIVATNTQGRRSVPVLLALAAAGLA